MAGPEVIAMAEPLVIGGVNAFDALAFLGNWYEH